MLIAPSILNLKKEDRAIVYKKFDEASISIIHIDVMDGIFVNNKTDGLELISSLKDYDFLIDTHLMVINPKNVIDDYVLANSDYITVHYEACTDLLDTLKYIKGKAKVGLSIKPNTKVQDIIPYLPFVDLVLVMSVEPGFGGQLFMESAYHKVSELNELRNDHDEYNYSISVDGGVNLEIAKKLSSLGCNLCVMGTYLLKCDDISHVVKSLE